MRTLRIVLTLAVLGWGGAPDAARAEQAPPTVRVDGRLMTVNGQQEVPRGLFGVHAVGLTPETIEDMGIECSRQIHFGPGSESSAIDKDGKVRQVYRKLAVVIDCQGDRYCAATVLTNPKYEEYFRQAGLRYGERCKQAGWRGYVEFWNEPYLNWAERSHGSPRNNYHERFYDVTKAADGGPVTIKDWDKPLEHLRWKRTWAKDEKGQIAWGVKVPEGLKPGGTFRSHSPKDWYWTDRREQTFTVVEEWHVHDPTQVGWWSGRQNLDFYLWMYLPFAKAVKEANPDVQVLAGWDFNPSTRNWAVWRELYQPVLDAAIQWTDGITEHHYGVDTRQVPAWYEVATAYTVSRHGKWIRSFNTECGGRLDPAVHGAAAGGAGMSEATYALRDILELAYHCPAKAGSRTAHHALPNTGAAAALRFLKDLRGPLVRTESSDLDVWPVACVNGQRLVAAVFNNAAGPRDVTFAIASPKGTTLGPGRLSALGAGDRDIPAKGGDVTLKHTLGPLQAVKLVFPLAGGVPRGPQVERRQFFAKEGVLHKVEPGKQVALSVNVDADLLARAERAWLKLVLEGVSGGEAKAAVNGVAVAIPDRSWVMELPLDASIVKPATRLVFTSAGDGYQIDAAGLLIEAPIQPKAP